MKQRFSKIIKQKWPLITAVSLFGLSLGLFLAVLFAPIQYKASTQVLITDASGATEKIVDAVLGSSMYRQAYERKAPGELKLAKLSVQQQGIGPLFAISASAADLDTAERATWRASKILDKNAKMYFGQFSDAKILSEPNVSPYSFVWPYLGGAGIGLVGGFALILAILGVLTKYKKNGKIPNVKREIDTPDVHADDPFVHTKIEPAMPILEDMPWVPEHKPLAEIEALPEIKIEPEMKPESEPEIEPILPQEEPVLEPVEPFSDDTETNVIVVPEAEEVEIEEKGVPVSILDFGQFPTTKPVVSEKEIQTMFEHLPQA